MGAHIIMQELIARLCGRQSSELQNHYWRGLTRQMSNMKDLGSGK
jgi:hypothetical protein